ncbi:hypothetical protein PQG02_28595 [Nostoc sp. UHCC 0926]|uniref:hypothetical protein n=1 Tax=Nostoc sp. UHCC 0926 TaxID=3025190 RepID=UPI00235E4F59|nr:hypothetical protein [Nostoc sp. UHCC 0926]WDD32564.1 hypothetical protein PQG02_28595 [Nostoc sp. UHCC 0926]
MVFVPSTQSAGGYACSTATLAHEGKPGDGYARRRHRTTSNLHHERYGFSRCQGHCLTIKTVATISGDRTNSQKHFGAIALPLTHPTRSGDRTHVKISIVHAELISLVVRCVTLLTHPTRAGDHTTSSEIALFTSSRVIQIGQFVRPNPGYLRLCSV